MRNHRALSIEFFKAFPDNHIVNNPYKILFANGDYTCLVADFTGTFKGPMKGLDGQMIQLTNKKFQTEFCSDTNWYKNMLVNPMLKLSLNGTEILSANGRPITDKNRVADVVRKFSSRYGEGEVKKYYTKFDAAVEVPL